MPAVISSKRVAEAALRKIGEFSINDSGADPAALEEALFWLDIIVGTLTASKPCQWLTSSTLSFSLTAGQRTYDLATALGNSAPTDRIFVVSYASVNDGNGNDEPLEILRRQEYENLPQKTTSGKPEQVYIDRLQSQSLFVYPVPGTGSSYTLSVIVQQYAPNLTKNSGNVAHGLPREWNQWLITALAAELGDGPVRRLPGKEIREMRAYAELLERRLDAYSNREKTTTGRTARSDV